jgi:hypothetical protein
MIKLHTWLSLVALNRLYMSMVSLRSAGAGSLLARLLICITSSYFTGQELERRVRS